MRDALADELYQLAKKDDRIVVLIGDVGLNVFDKFRTMFPNRFFNMGLSEQNMVTVACGLADEGYVPFVYAITPHLIMRAYEQVRNDVCYNNCNVKLVGVGSGLHYSNQGFTHQSLEDIAVINPLPNINIFSPCDALEMRQVVKASTESGKPTYIRVSRNNGSIYTRYYGEGCNFKIGRGVILENGFDAAIITTGSCVYDALLASYELKERGTNVKVLHIPTIKPIDERLIFDTIKETENILTLEEHNVVGGLGSMVAGIFSTNYIYSPHSFRMLGVRRYKPFVGTYGDLKKLYGIDKESIVKTCNCKLIHQGK